jgi:hypothetical protein
MKEILNGKAEAGQDHFAYEQNGYKKNGSFLDIGSNEPIANNNTYALETEAGWRGWLLDIEAAYAEPSRLLRKSPFIAADATTLDWSFLGSVSLLDYLSLDIDENENRDRALTILYNLISAGYRFRCMTVEHDAYRYGDNPRAGLRKLLLEAGYTLAHADVEIRKGCGKPFEDWWVLTKS